MSEPNRNDNEEQIALDLARQMAELNRKNAKANEELKKRSEAERKKQEEEEAKRTRALEQEVLDRKLSKETARRKEFYEALKDEYEEEKKEKNKSGLFGGKKEKKQKSSGFSLFGKKKEEAKKPSELTEVPMEKLPRDRVQMPTDKLIKKESPTGLWKTETKETIATSVPKDTVPAEPAGDATPEEPPVASEPAPVSAAEKAEPEPTAVSGDGSSLFSALKDAMNQEPEAEPTSEPEPAPEPVSEPVPVKGPEPVPVQETKPASEPAPVPVEQPKAEPKPNQTPVQKDKEKPEPVPVPSEKPKKPFFASIFEKKPKASAPIHKEKNYPTKKLTHENPEDKELADLKEKLYPGKYEASSDGRVEVAASDPDQSYIDWKEQAKKSRERLDADRFRTMLHDVQEHENDIVVMALITSDMDKLVLLRSLDEFFQFVEKQDYNVVLSYAFVIYKHEDPKYYLEIPDDEHIQELMGSIYDLFMKNTIVTPNMIGQIPNIGIFKEIYINNPS